VNKSLNWLAGHSVFSTPVGKNLDILSWKGRHKHTEMNADVIQAAYSTDRFYTVDMRIRTMQLDGRKLDIEPGKSFIRAEICIRCVPLKEDQRPKAGDVIQLAGKLKWDGDGFLEVHPQQVADVRILQTGGESR